MKRSEQNDVFSIDYSKYGKREEYSGTTGLQLVFGKLCAPAGVTADADDEGIAAYASGLMLACLICIIGSMCLFKQVQILPGNRQKVTGSYTKKQASYRSAAWVLMAFPLVKQSCRIALTI